MIMIMIKNPMPALDNIEQPDYHQSLGILGMLMIYCQHHDLSLGGSYQLASEAMKKGQLYFCVNDDRQPLGAVIWAHVAATTVEALKSNGWNTENDLLALLGEEEPLNMSIDKNADNKADPDSQLLLLQLISPFGAHLALIESWRQHYQLMDIPCWALAERQHKSLRRIF